MRLNLLTIKTNKIPYFKTEYNKEYLRVIFIDKYLLNRIGRAKTRFSKDKTIIYIDIDISFNYTQYLQAEIFMTAQMFGFYTTIENGCIVIDTSNKYTDNIGYGMGL